MKKVIIAAVLFFSVAGIMAQTTPKKETPKQEQKEQKSTTHKAGVKKHHAKKHHKSTVKTK